MYSPTDFTDLHRSSCCVYSPTDFTEFTELLAECILPQISQNSQNRLLGMVSHRFHRFTQIVWVPSRGCTCLKCTNVTRGISILLGWCTSCSGKRQSRAETSAPPEVGRFCEFCAICGSYFVVAEARIPPLLSSAPNESVLICEICGRLSSAAGSVDSVQSVGGLLLARLVHFLLWQAAKPSGDKCTP